MEREHSHFYAFLVPSKEVKTVKTTLERADTLHKRLKIRPQSPTQKSAHLIVPTNVPALDASPLKSFDDMPVPLQSLHLNLEVVIVNQQIRNKERKSSLVDSVSRALEELPASLMDALHLSPHVLLQNLNSSCYMYNPMLLLPAHVFGHEAWKALFGALKCNPANKNALFSSLARNMQVTHIAIDAPIPFHIPWSRREDALCEENLLRSPTNLQPMYGDFGEPLPPFPSYHPTNKDFTNAFWVSTKQNGVNQIWAPRYSMFSAGNVTEKARILRLPSVSEAVRRGQESGRGSAAVDLFAGIGYFAFSYAKAGVQKIVCWDLNPWSIEALRRGAELNKWTAQVHWFSDKRSLCEEELTAFCQGADRFLVLNESNIVAKSRIQQIRRCLPPIRHVNCGMLPSANPAWQTAVQAIDQEQGGWLHLHETVGDAAINTRVNEIEMKISEHFRELRCRTEFTRSHDIPRLEHVEKVKSMGPRMIHIVLDMWIPPI